MYSKSSIIFSFSFLVLLFGVPASGTTVTCDGTNDHVDIQTAIDNLPSGGGVVTIESGTCDIASPIMIGIDDLTLEGRGGSTVLEASGSSAVAQVSGSLMRRLSLRNFRITSENEDIVALLLRSFRHSVIENIDFEGSGLVTGWTSVFLKIEPDHDADADPPYLPVHYGNTTYNDFRNLSAIGMKTGVVLNGYFDYGEQHNKITNNRFFNLTLIDTQLGIRVTEHADTNSFTNVNIQLDENAPYLIGVALNYKDCSPATLGTCSAQVYSIDFKNLAIEVFFAETDPGAIGIRFGQTHAVQILGLTINDQVATPIQDVSGSAKSYLITQRGDWDTSGFEDKVIVRGKGVSYQMVPQATAPSNCTLGDQYVDTSGALCHCDSGGSWILTTDLSNGGSPNCT